MERRQAEKAVASLGFQRIAFLTYM
jgi:hypothetical protein